MTSFRRDKATWTTYAAFALLGFVQAALGPILPALREELGISHAVGGLHLSAFAAGALLASATSARAASAFGLRRVLWAAVGGVGGGCLLLAAARSPVVTLAAAAVLGLFCGALIAAVQALLSARHGDARAVALVEADVAASLGAFAVPLAVAAGQWTGLGWRIVLVGAATAGAVLTGVGRRTGPAADVAPPATPPGGRDAAARLAPVLVLVFAVVAAEWSVGFWAATVLHERAGASSAGAAAGASAFFGAMLGGRVLAGALVRRAPAPTIATVALVVALAGFPLLWWARTPLPALAGLLVCGLAIAPLFPLAISVGLRQAGGRQLAAVARMGVAGALALLVAPYALGALADAAGLGLALGSVPALLVLALAALGALTRRRTAAAPAPA